MEFIIHEAEVSDEIYSENSDCSEAESVFDDFIKQDCNEEIDSATFYRNFENSQRFQNQQKNIAEEIDKDEELYYGEDGQPEMFAPEDSKHIEFHSFNNYKKKAEEFKRTLLRFENISVKNHFFYSAVYALAYLKNPQKPIDFNSAVSIIVQDKFVKLKDIEKEIILNYTQFGFFDRCMKLNNILAEQFGFF